jgi:formate C-acetyltransferase
MVRHMERIEMQEGKVIPWWERSRTHNEMWKGTLVDRMILKGEDEEEQRIQRLRDKNFERPEGKRGYLSIWRAKLMTDSYRETEGEAEVIRRAKAFKHVCENIPIPHQDGQLLMGETTTIVPGTQIEQEFQSRWLARNVFVTEVNKNMSELDAISVRGTEAWIVSDEDREILREYIIPYWRNRTPEASIEKQLLTNYPDVPFQEGHFVGRASYPIPEYGLCHTLADYNSAINRGLNGLKVEIRAEMNKIDGSNPISIQDFDRKNTYTAMLTTADAIIIYANRCADLASELASKETNPQKKTELEEMARICRKVPEHPAESWWEAIQSLLLLWVAVCVSEGGSAHALGRLDQYMYPYLKRDLESGRITLKQAQELLECLFLKLRQRVLLRQYRAAKRMRAVHSQVKINFGGVDSNGQDATNELSYMLLEAHAHVHVNDPELTLRIHKHTPDSLLKATLETLRLGTGAPHIINDEVIIPGLMRLGVSLKDARSYGDIGCQENAPDPNICGADTNTRANAGWFNLPKMVEYALYDGIDKTSGLQGGARTGDPRDFKSMNEFFEAVKKQTEFHIHANCTLNNLMDWAFTNYTPVIVLDLLHSGPRKSGIDYQAGGCKYNWTGAIGVGIGTAADSLTAIEWLVYDRKEITMSQLLQAMDNDWLGYEHIRKKCRRAPKYGNDNNYADKWAVRLSNIWMDAYEKHKTAHGGRFVVGLFSVSTYVFMGSETWASPDGRRAAEPLSSATDPSNSTDLEGITLLHKSAAKFDTFRTTNGMSFNCKLPTSAVATEREISKWADLVRTFVLMGGQSAQYNVVGREALKDAQKQPEDYKDLIVRVGGYSAVFVELDKQTQDTIITRTDHQL